MTYSVMLVIVPLPPAFTVKRRLLEPSARLEASGFAALRCRHVHDVELNLLGQLLLIIPVGLYGVAAVVGAYWTPPEAIGIAFG